MKTADSPAAPSSPSESPTTPGSRRQFLAAGTAGLLGLSVFGATRLRKRGEADQGEMPTPAQEMAGIQLPAGSDVAAHSTAENRFWNRILMDHARFFTMLMPGSELSGPRDEAMDFAKSFRSQLEKALKTDLKKDTYEEFNRTSLDHAKRFEEWRLRMRDEQASGKIWTLVWPSFFQAASMEAGRFAKRLEQLNRGASEFERSEVIPFWMSDNSDHSAMIAHFLDPQEHRLIQHAMVSSKKYSRMRAAPPARHGTADPALETAQEIVTFETEIHQGILEGTVHSILQPLMTDHMRREGMRFVEELKRAQ